MHDGRDRKHTCIFLSAALRLSIKYSQKVAEISAAAGQCTENTRQMEFSSSFSRFRNHARRSMLHPDVGHDAQYFP
jgi:hypothetical protein